MADGTAWDFADAPDPEELAKFELNDFGNAMRLVRHIGAVIDPLTGDVGIDGAILLYQREVGWIGWNGRAWDLKMGARLAERTAHRVVQELVQQRKHMLERGFNLKEVDGFIRQAGNAGRISAMLQVAEAYLQVDLEVFDTAELALSVGNGTLRFARLAGGGCDVRFEPHDPRHRITRLADVEYDPAAKAPLWEASLARWQPDPEMRAYLQRAVGYMATGFTHEQAFWIFQGKGRDGKSTMVGALRELLGGYADVADVRTFLDVSQRGGADASPDLARLAGDCRMISVAEPPRGAKLAEAMIKSFTGGAPILARRLRQDLFSFMPRPKVFMECNSRPVIKGDDEGIWRRIHLVMFEHQVAPAEVDRELGRKLRAEYPGILNWIVEGVAEWLDRGLDPPERVKAALEDYRKGSSPFGEWFAERLVLEPGVKTLASDFYADFKSWCEEQGIERVMTLTAFGNALADRQVIRAGMNGQGKVMRSGARLKTPAELAADREGYSPGGSSATPFDPDLTAYGYTGD
jgi:putative DNA primase/helicase